MVVAAVATVMNEADIIPTTIRHLIAEGVEIIALGVGPSMDGTKEVIQMESMLTTECDIRFFDDPSPTHYQPQWINWLAMGAINLGANWVIPFDADEFVYATDGSTVAEALDTVPDWGTAVMMKQYRHVSWNVRQEWHTLPKIAARASALAVGTPPIHRTTGARFTNGNHGLTEGVAVGDSPLAIRELHYRGFDHFVRKTRERCATIDPTLPAGDGAHQLMYRGMGEDELWQEWIRLQIDHAVYLDPIPSRVPYIERVGVSQ